MVSLQGRRHAPRHGVFAMQRSAPQRHVECLYFGGMATLPWAALVWARGALLFHSFHQSIDGTLHSRTASHFSAISATPRRSQQRARPNVLGVQQLRSKFAPGVCVIGQRRCYCRDMETLSKLSPVGDAAQPPRGESFRCGRR